MPSLWTRRFAVALTGPGRLFGGHRAGAARGPFEIRTRQFAGFRDESHRRLVELCRAQVHLDDLHYIGYYAGGKNIFAMDVFDDPRLAHLHSGLAEQHRTSFDAHGPIIEHTIEEFSRTFRSLDIGLMARLALDVRQGAIYYHTVDRDAERYLLGVTLSRKTPNTADAKLAGLVDDMRTAMGLPRSTV
jgi:hypothetical protein